MSKVAVVLLADDETHEGSGRAVNAFELVKELKDNGDEVRLVFDGGGTRWAAVLNNSEHDVYPLIKAVEDKIDGACRFCSKAFGVINEVNKAGVPLLNDYDEHPSLRSYIAVGYQVITF